MTAIAADVVPRARLLATPAPRGEWLDLLQHDPEALPFQHPSWTDAAIAVSGGRDASRLYELPGGRHAVLPAVARPATRLPGGAFLALLSQPYGWGAGGLVAAGEQTDGDAAAVLADLVTLPALSLSVHPTPRRGRVWAGTAADGWVVSPHTAHVLDLAGGLETVWEQRFTSKTRRAIRKAEHAAVTIECDTTGRLVGEFDHLYRRSVERWAGQQHEPVWLAQVRARRRDPARKFATVAALLGDACRFWIARDGAEPVAGIVTLQLGEHVVYWRGAMDKDRATPVRANELLHRTAIEWAIADGARLYHLGDSAPGSGLARFKESLGAVPVAYGTLGHERLPLARADAALRGAVKRVLRFRD
ncbi:MAG TPA: GNAT family N-acetyltransferase [Amnibacterium sp.]|jgi:hypothetical protein|uniref:GNAT family N-acetyltransferase n=1 Tax=Amnibacterium sp. TaxID=1872496 RepID=UPI002DF79FB1|nr:GNAT family N-acetyltransferase [Blastococcus sp.]